MNVHFICRGNILRSFIAEAYLRSCKLDNITCISSGVTVDLDDEAEKGHFRNSSALLRRHGILEYAKTTPEQLMQERLNNNDITICMNQRVIDEAQAIVTLPGNTINWNIEDIGEGKRAIRADVNEDRLGYEEEIYQEITDKVDQLILSLDAI